MDATTSLRTRPARPPRFRRAARRSRGIAALAVLAGAAALIGGAGRVTALSGSSWRGIGPFGGDVYEFAFPPGEAGVVLAATGAGVFRTVDGGAHWAPFAFPGKLVRTVVIHPADATNLWASVSDDASWAHGGVFRSTDGGRSWVPASAGVFTGPVNQIALDPVDTRRAYVATEEGLFVTGDGGGSWQPAPGRLGMYGVWRVVADLQRPGTVYAVLGATLYRSTDGGATWAALEVGPPEPSFDIPIAVDPTEPGTVYASSDGTLLASRDGGDTWEPATNGLPPGATTTVAATVGGDGGALFALAGDSKIYRSVDHGRRWVDSGAMPAPSWSPDGPVQGNLDVDPRQRSEFWVGSAGLGAFASRDGGTTWVEASQGIAGTAVTSLFVDAQGRTFVGTRQQGIFRSDDGGSSWRHAAGGLRYNSNDFEHPAFAVTGFASEPGADGRMYAATTRGVYVTANLGESWSQLRLPMDGVTGVTVDPRDRATLCASVEGNGMSPGGAFVSHDSGATWTSTTSSLGVAVNVYSMTRSPWDGASLLAPAWILRSEGTDPVGWLLESIDGGAGWIMHGPLPSPYNEAFAPAPDVLGSAYAADSHGVYTTANLWNWQAADPGLGPPDPPGSAWAFHALAVDPTDPDTVIAAASTGVYVSRDRGQHWTNLSAGLSCRDVRALLFDPASGKLLIGTNGCGVFVLEPGRPPIPRRHLSAAPASR